MKIKPNKDNVFSGPNGHVEFLDPDYNPPSPLVEVPQGLNELYEDGVRIFIKMPPPLSMKQLGAAGMLKKRAAQPGFDEVNEIWIPSSGNMGIALGVEARVRHGKWRTNSIVPADIAPGKFEFMRLTGIRVMLDSALPEGYTGMSYAKEMGSREGAWYAAQYEDESNPHGYRQLAREIWRQTRRRLKFISFGTGTTGMGNGLKDVLGEKVENIAGHPSSEDQIPGTRSKERLKKVPLYKPDRFKHLVEITTHTAYVWSFRLCQFGLLLGPSTGLAYAAMLKILKKLKKQGRLKRYQDANCEIVVVVIGHDTPFLYLDKYSTQLNKRDYAWRPK